MSTVSKPNTFSANTVISPSEVNSNFDTIYNEFNGNISAANLATSAVSTAKVADSAVTTAKINDLAVTTAKIADANVTSEKLTNTIAFRGTTTQTLADSAAFSDITTYTEVFDTGSDFNHTTGVFTAPVTGLYLLTTTLGFNDPTTGSRRFGCQITAGGTVVAAAYASATQTNHDPFITACAVVKMTAAQTAIVAAYQDTGGTEALTTPSSFSGYFIGVT